MTYLNLDLESAPLTPQIAQAIERNTNLEHLSLTVDEFDGAVFTRLENLQRLDYASVGVGIRVKNLDVLSKLPALEGLQLFASPALPGDLEFVSNCKNLRSLSVIGGMSDDTTAKAIGESPTLVSVTMGQDCFMTDEGVGWLAKNRRLEWISIGGEITADAARKLKGLPQLDYLSVWSDAISKEQREILKREFDGVNSDFRDFDPSSGKHKIGTDGIWRMALRDGDIAFDELEGKDARELFGDEFFEQVQSNMEDKVVLVEFWGTWCGPCLMLKPRIEELADKYKKVGLEVVSIHSQRGVDKLGEYISENPFRWTNLVDGSNGLAQSFGVRLYPSLYLFDRTGKLRVARAHKLKIGDAVERLLKE